MDVMFWVFLLTAYVTFFTMIITCIVKGIGDGVNIYRVVLVVPGMLSMFVLAQSGGYMVDFSNSNPGDPKITTYFGSSLDRTPQPAELTIRGNEDGAARVVTTENRYYLVARLASEPDPTVINISNFAESNHINLFQKQNGTIIPEGAVKEYNLWISIFAFYPNNAVVTVCCADTTSSPPLHTLVGTHKAAPLIVYETYTFGLDGDNIPHNVTSIEAFIVEAPMPEVWSMWHWALGLVLLLYVILHTLEFLLIDRMAQMAKRNSPQN